MSCGRHSTRDPVTVTITAPWWAWMVLSTLSAFALGAFLLVLTR